MESRLRFDNEPAVPQNCFLFPASVEVFNEQHVESRIGAWEKSSYAGDLEWELLFTGDFVRVSATRDLWV